MGNLCKILRLILQPLLSLIRPFFQQDAVIIHFWKVSSHFFSMVSIWDKSFSVVVSFSLLQIGETADFLKTNGMILIEIKAGNSFDFHIQMDQSYQRISFMSCLSVLFNLLSSVILQQNIFIKERVYLWLFYLTTDQGHNIQQNFLICAPHWY